MSSFGYSRGEWDQSRELIRDQIDRDTTLDGEQVGALADKITTRLHGSRPNPEPPDFRICLTESGDEASSMMKYARIYPLTGGSQIINVAIDQERVTLERAIELRDALTKSIDWATEYGKPQ